MPATLLLRYLLGECKTALNCKDLAVMQQILKDTIAKIEEWQKEFNL